VDSRFRGNDKSRYVIVNEQLTVLLGSKSVSLSKYICLYEPLASQAGPADPKRYEDKGFYKGPRELFILLIADDSQGPKGV
jgi:hypothetical protein